MTGRSRVAIAALVLLGILAGVVLVAFAGSACATDTVAQPCPDVGRNRAVVVSLAAATVALLVAPFALLAEFAVRRRIVYRGAWGRATRRALLVAGTAAAVAGLRLGGALSVPAALFVVTLAAVVEWFAVRRFDMP
ncbi:MAG TPA: hypothetical protein VI733_02450 [Candidatus Limnocylindria bacterium]|nr:hypothetical protein [Candidatus Limnocylindria bacterium]